MKFRSESRFKLSPVIVGFGTVLVSFLSGAHPVDGTANLTSNSSAVYAGSVILVSEPQNHFELGIFQLDKAGRGAYYLCIRYAHVQTPVWVLRDYPLTSARSHLNLSATGILQLFDGDTPRWKSSTTNATVAKLLDAGNLVLDDSQGNTVWNSFNDSIQDTMLPGQYLFRASANQDSLTSWVSGENPAQGKYVFGWGTASLENAMNVSNVLRLECLTCNAMNGSTTGRVYVPAPDLHNAHVISTADSVYFHPTLGGLYFPPPLNSSNSALPSASTLILSDFQQQSSGTFKRLTLDPDGGLRIWLWKIGESSEWTPVANWVVTERGTQCAAMDTCGPFGLCQMNPSNSLDRVQCSCPEGFQPSDGYITKGCVPKKPLGKADSCGEVIEMTVLEGIDMPWNGDLGPYIVETNITKCNETCWFNCSCSAAVFSQDEKRCWMKTLNVTNLGYPSVEIHGSDRTSIIKIFRFQDSDEHKSKLWIILGPILVAVLILSACIFVFRNRLRQICRILWTKSRPDDYPIPDFSETDTAPPKALGDVNPPGVEMT